MVLEQGALTGRYSPENPLPAGSSRAEAYNGMLPQMAVLTDELASIGRQHDAAASDVATAWAIAKGATPITKPGYIDGLVRPTGMTLSSDDIAELELIADTASLNTRGWWEKDMEP